MLWVRTEAKSRESVVRSAIKARHCRRSALGTHKTGGARESGRSFPVASASSPIRLGKSNSCLTTLPTAWAARRVAALSERYRQSAQSAECGGWQSGDECSSTWALAADGSDVDMTSASAVAGATATCSSAQLPIRRRIHIGRTDMDWTIAGLLSRDNLPQPSSGSPEPSNGRGGPTNGVSWTARKRPCVPPLPRGPDAHTAVRANDLPSASARDHPFCRHPSRSPSRATRRAS